METPESIYIEIIKNEIQYYISVIERKGGTDAVFEDRLNNLIRMKNNEKVIDKYDPEYRNRYHNEIVDRKYKNHFKNISKRDKVAKKIEKILFNMELKNKMSQYFIFHNCEDDKGLELFGKCKNYSKYLKHEELYLKYLVDIKTALTKTGVNSM